jgi:hypothetical protein
LTGPQTSIAAPNCATNYRIDCAAGNGDGKADFEIELSGLHVLTALDFLL